LARLLCLDAATSSPLSLSLRSSFPHAARQRRATMPLMLTLLPSVQDASPTSGVEEAARFESQFFFSILNIFGF
jgi:hypothetical protein